MLLFSPLLGREDGPTGGHFPPKNPSKNDKYQTDGDSFPGIILILQY